MAPLKSVRAPILPAVRSNLVTRQAMKITAQLAPSMATRLNKRKAECSPPKQTTTVKRHALGDVTNNIQANKVTVRGNDSKVNKRLPAKRSASYTKSNKTVQNGQNGLLAAGQAAPANARPKVLKALKDLPAKLKTRLSNEFEENGQEKASSSVPSPINEISNGHDTSPPASLQKTDHLTKSLVALHIQNSLFIGDHKVPDGVTDFDKEHWDDVFHVSHYAMDIFNYLKSRESYFEIPDYMHKQVSVTRHMRALLVDWMVEIQESFELNHETLYLGVKLLDIYLSKVVMSKETLQLLGATAMFVASKYDERLPPLIDDFLYICDGAYNRRELLRMEINLLKVCNFELSIPISYRFLRRYARCAKISMQILTLARYILETSLLEYETVMIRDSILAAAALFLAMQMQDLNGWTPTLQFYTGYKLTDIIDVVYQLNSYIQRKPKEQLMTVQNKYSHETFFKVASIPTISNENICVKEL